MLLSKAAPGVDLELIDNWIINRYNERILSSIPWKRSETTSIIQSPASVIAGTVAVNQGSTSITGTGTAWSATQTGLMIRIGGGPITGALGLGASMPAGQEYYQFTYVSATSGTLDRPYEQPTGSLASSQIHAGGTGYAIGDQFTITGYGIGPAIGQVTAVGVSGAVTGYVLAQNGAGYSVGTAIATTTTGAGTGLTIDILTVTPGSGLSYRIDQAVFLLPSNARILKGVYPMHDRFRSLELITPAELNRRDPQRRVYGIPRACAHTWDNGGTPPQLQLELWPVPSSPDYAGATISHVVDYVYDPATLNPGTTGSSLLPWMSSGAMWNGVMADISLWRSSLPKSADLFLPNGVTTAQGFEKYFGDFLQSMKVTNARQIGNAPMRLAEEFEGNGGRYYRRGPWHRGFTG